MIDLRTLLPWDKTTLVASLKKTGRLSINHEAPKTSCFGAELAASLQEACFLHLESPILRVTGWDTPFPLALEKEYFPNALRTLDAIQSSMDF